MKKLSELSIAELILLNMQFNGAAQAGLRFDNELIIKQNKIVEELIKQRKELGEIDFKL
jgi:hypothetical protein